jgi:hypothetical protein
MADQCPERRAETESEQNAGYIPPFLLDLPTADPADLPAMTLDPLTIRCIRDREDPTSSHRTRRNR